MNANEIVKELRDMATYDCGFEQQSDTVEAAADLIESLQADLTQVKNELADYNCDTKIGCKLIEKVKAERDAAVKDLEHIANEIEECNYEFKDIELKVSSLRLGRCDVCTKKCYEGGSCNFEWRGPQEAEEGKTE